MAGELGHYIEPLLYENSETKIYVELMKKEAEEWGKWFYARPLDPEKFSIDNIHAGFYKI